jgi:hypothetical protein
MFEVIFIIVLIVVFFLIFLVVLEISKCDVHTSSKSIQIFTCQTSRFSELHRIQLDNSRNNSTYTHSMGFEYVHVPLETDLHTFVDFVNEKLYKYTKVKSLILRHLYFVKCTYQLFPDFDLNLPSYKSSLVIVNLDDQHPLYIKHPTDKPTVLQKHMMAFTQFSTPSKNMKISGSCFLYGVLTQLSTLDYY